MLALGGTDGGESTPQWGGAVLVHGVQVPPLRAFDANPNPSPNPSPSPSPNPTNLRATPAGTRDRRQDRALRRYDLTLALTLRLLLALA